MPKLLHFARRAAVGAPLLLPLIAVVGCVCDRWWLSGAAVLVAVGLRLWREAFVAALLAAFVLFRIMAAERAETVLRQRLDEQGVVELHGSVERVKNNFAVLQTGWNGVRVSLNGTLPEVLQPGDALTVLAEEKEEVPPPFPGMFDSAEWRRSQGIAAGLQVLEARRTGRPFSLALLRAQGLRVRGYLVRRLMPAGTESETPRQVLCAMVLGAKDEADAETLADFRRGGCLHVFAVSGLHVGVIALILWQLMLWLRLSPNRARWLSLLLVGAYVLVTGAPVSAARAYVMLAVLMGGVLFRRRVSMLNTWCFAALLTLLCDPSQLGNAGFLLSFSVYAAICLGWRLCQRFDRPWFGPDDYLPYVLLSSRELKIKEIEQMVRGVVVVSMCAWSAALPITLNFFHTANPYSFLTNIVIAPVVYVVMCAGLAQLALGWVPYLGVVTDAAAVKAAGLLLSVVSFFGDGSAAYLPAAPPRPADTLLVLPTGYDHACCVLGNPGVVIDPGNDYAAVHTVIPALFHGGFTPAAVLPLRPAAAAQTAARKVLKEQPHAVLLPVSENVCRWSNDAGTFTVYPAAAGLPARPAANRCPIAIWQHGEQRVMYLGDASRLTWETLPPEERRADILIIGHHPALPLTDPQDWSEMGVKTLILLPSAARLPLSPQLPCRVIRVATEKCLIRLSE